MLSPMEFGTGSPPPLRQPPLRQGRPTGDWFKRFLAPVGIAVVVLLKFGAKLKFLLLPILKFFPVLLKTGGSMVVSIWFYALAWGVWFAVGFVLLLFVHELGHLLAARQQGLKVGVPVFIPFMGAIIALKEAPRNAWIEAQVGIGGPMLGTLGAGICYVIYVATGQPFWSALAYTGFFLNLFNLAPIGFLDGGRIVTALSPWLWLVGLVVVGAMAVARPNFLILLILVMSLPRLFFLFRRKTAEEKRYFEVSQTQRLSMAAMYFGLIAILLLGMQLAHVERGSEPQASTTTQR
jgi:Zn-dependent protease